MIKRIVSYLIAAAVIFCTPGVLAADTQAAIRIEGESGRFSNLQYGGDAKFFGYYTDENPAPIETTADIPEGWYIVEFAATPGDWSNKWVSAYKLTIGGEEINVPNGTALTERPGGAFDGVGKKYVTDKVFINGGENVIAFNLTGKTVNNNYNIYLDYISLIPTEAPIDSGIYQMEGESDFKYADGKKMEKATDKDGSVFGVYSKNTAEELTASFNVLSEGDYYFTFAATPGDGSNQYTSKYDVKINDELINVPSSDVSAGLLNVGKLYSAGTVHLNRGINKVSFTVKSLTANNTYLLYLDYVKFVIRKDYDFNTFSAEDFTVYEQGTAEPVITDINREKVSAEYVDSISYKSSDDNIAFIDGNGLICGKNVGKAEIEITVKRENEIWNGKAIVNVLNPDTGILFKNVEKTETGIKITLISKNQSSGIPVQVIAVARGESGIENIYVKSVSDYVSGGDYILDIPMQAGSKKTDIYAWCDMLGRIRKIAAETISVN